MNVNMYPFFQVALFFFLCTCVSCLFYFFVKYIYLTCTVLPYVPKCSVLCYCWFISHAFCRQSNAHLSLPTWNGILSPGHNIILLALGKFWVAMPGCDLWIIYSRFYYFPPSPCHHFNYLVALALPNRIYKHLCM